jgi:peptidoglycan/LPS O-acetylase OafA/YrhL
MPESLPDRSPSLWQPQRHIPQLDGVRGLAILVVTLYRFSKEIPTNSWLGQALHSLFALGDRGVDLFFVLSGFLITGILVDAKGSQHYFSSFLARRSLRIFPLYFAAIFICLVASSWVPAFQGMFAQGDQNQFYLWTYLTNVKMSVDGAWSFGYLDHFWSLAVEEHFYLVWPLAVFLCCRATALRLACVLAVSSAVFRVVFATLSDNGVAPDVLTLFRCDALLIGAMLALQIRSPRGLAPIQWWTLALFPACLAIGLWASVSDKRLFTLPHTLWPLMWACILVWLLKGHESGLLARFFNLSILRKFGKFSYALYVFQSPLIPIVGAVCSVPILTSLTGDALVGNLLYIGLMFGLTYGAAQLSWHLLEKHCLKLKDWFPTHASPAAQLAPRPASELARNCIGSA